jgi:putative membrane protein
VNISSLPALNAVLNSTATVLIVLGWLHIRAGRRDLHRKTMLAAVATSTLFLASYLYYHAHAGATRFTEQGLLRTIYFTILISHTILAALTPVLVGTSVVLALRGRFERHRAVARWTLPIWLYVSVTGVTIYVMLYHLWPPTA